MPSPTHTHLTQQAAEPNGSNLASGEPELPSLEGLDVRYFDKDYAAVFHELSKLPPTATQDATEGAADVCTAALEVILLHAYLALLLPMATPSAKKGAADVCAAALNMLVLHSHYVRSVHQLFTLSQCPASCAAEKSITVGPAVVCPSAT